ncbi:hypothetical protein [Heyndrickxia coagulans]|uniref:hypothetical protein n=1 Tax=Heyndrickxia coagulans TaxID=1398 RepID=UPI00062875D2|nr:hypothetical protein [Heyndrickxia coagulans]
MGSPENEKAGKTRLGFFEGMDGRNCRNHDCEKDLGNFGFLGGFCYKCGHNRKTLENPRFEWSAILF